MQSVPITNDVSVTLLKRGVFDTTLGDKVSLGLAAAQWFSPGTLVSSTNKTDHHNIAEILLKVVLNIKNQSSYVPQFVVR
jgi:hypothetical protein